VPAAQFRWLAGEGLAQRYDLPGAKRFAVGFCPRCGTRVPHRVTGTDNMLIPAGVLDGTPDLRPEGSIFWDSRAEWFIETQSLPKSGEYGR